MSTLLWVALGSAAGAPARYLLDRLIQSRHDRVFPWGTFTVNVTGSFLLGLLLAPGQVLEPWIVTALGTGFLGSYTTFSTFNWETIRLVEDGALLVAGLNLLVSVCVGAASAGAGLLLGALVPS